MAKKPIVERLENSLRVFQSLRDSGRMSRSEAFYFVANCIMGIADNRISPEHNPTLFNDDGNIESPEDTFDKDLVKIEAGTFREYGEAGMAELYMNDRKEFWRRYEEGRRAVEKSRRERGEP